MKNYEFIQQACTYFLSLSLWSPTRTIKSCSKPISSDILPGAPALSTLWAE